MNVKQLKTGDFFTKKVIECPRDCQVWVRGAFDRSLKKYECTRFDDTNTTCYLPGNKEIYTDFVF